MKSINPATGQVIKEYPNMSNEEASRIVDHAHDAFLEWRNTDFQSRAALMIKAADVLKADKERYAHIMTEEMGKVKKEALAEVEKCAWVCRYYAENAERFLKDEAVETDAKESFVTYQPIGVVLAVMPWNFPLWQVFRFAAPALMAGNAGILKHASNVAGCALAIEEVFHKAGFPKNIFRTLLIASDQVGDIIEHNKVQAVTLTGSTGAGKAVAAKAGECLKKTVLELGGSDPYIVLEDADIEHAVELCVKSRLINAGQSCIAAKRFIVVEAVYDEYLEKFTNAMKAIKMGDPSNEENDIGPQASFELRDELHQQVQKSIEKGAECVLGGEIAEGEGAYYPPTILTNVSKGMPAYDDELFGPVASIIKAKDEGDAIAIANNSVFGLGGAVFTKDIARGKRIARDDVQAGACFVNDFVKSDPRLPFGGIKESGYGRELSHYGIREFVNIKAVSINES